MARESAAARESAVAGEIFVNRGADERIPAILFGISSPGDKRSSSDVLAELSRLADTGGFELRGFVTQHRRSCDPNTYMGAGKLAEIAELSATEEAEVAICNDTLNPSHHAVPPLLFAMTFHHLLPDAKLPKELIEDLVVRDDP